jgi:hypothetical protein
MDAALEEMFAFREADHIEMAALEDSRSLGEVIKYLNPILRGWSQYHRWLNSAYHFRKIDEYVVFKLQRWLRPKQRRTKRAFRRPPDAWWWEQGLYRCAGKKVPGC